MGQRLGKSGQNLIGVLVAVFLAGLLTLYVLDMARQGVGVNSAQRFRDQLSGFKSAISDRIMNDPQSWALTVDAMINNPNPNFNPLNPADQEIGTLFWCISRISGPGTPRSEQNNFTPASATGECAALIHRPETHTPREISILSRSGPGTPVLFHDHQARQGFSPDGSACTFDASNQSACFFRPRVWLMGIDCDLEGQRNDSGNLKILKSCTQPAFRVHLDFEANARARAELLDRGSIDLKKYEADFLIPSPPRAGCHPRDRSGESCLPVKVPVGAGTSMSDANTQTEPCTLNAVLFKCNCILPAAASSGPLTEEQKASLPWVFQCTSP